MRGAMYLAPAWQSAARWAGCTTEAASCDARHLPTAGAEQRAVLVVEASF